MTANGKTTNPLAEHQQNFELTLQCRTLVTFWSYSYYTAIPQSLASLTLCFVISRNNGLELDSTLCCDVAGSLTPKKIKYPIIVVYLLRKNNTSKTKEVVDYALVFASLPQSSEVI